MNVCETAILNPGNPNPSIVQLSHFLQLSCRIDHVYPAFALSAGKGFVFQAGFGTDQPTFTHIVTQRKYPVALRDRAPVQVQKLRGVIIHLVFSAE